MIINADARYLPIANDSVQCVVTSPPYYGLRDYGEGDQIGIEKTLIEYINNIVQAFEEVRRVLRPDGVAWLNLGDTYCNMPQGSRFSESRIEGSIKNKDLMMVPHRCAIALQDAGWFIRSEIIWNKLNPMPESVKDRCSRSHEIVFMLAKSPKYFYNSDAIRTPFSQSMIERIPLIGTGKTYGGKGRGAYGKKSPSNGAMAGISANLNGANKKTVWTLPSAPQKAAHFATFPPALIEPMILAGSNPGDIVCDPFAGSGTVGNVCRKHNRKFVGTDLSIEYLETIALPRAEGKQTESSINELPLFQDLP